MVDQRVYSSKPKVSLSNPQCRYENFRYQGNTMLIKFLRLVIVVLALNTPLLAKIVHIGTGRDFPNIRAACASLQPGDSVIVHSGVYDTYQYYAGLKGTPAK